MNNTLLLVVTLVITLSQTLCAYGQQPIITKDGVAYVLRPSVGSVSRATLKAGWLQAPIMDNKQTIGQLSWQYQGNSLTIRVRYDQSKDFAGLSWQALGPIYGLGDHGSYLSQANLEGLMIDSLGALAKSHGDGERFISTFTIAPKQGLAWCISGWGPSYKVYNPAIKYVHYTGPKYGAGIRNGKQVELKFWHGSVPSLYAGMHKLAIQKSWTLPYDRRQLMPWFYELGYEAFGSLGWNTSQQKLIEDLRTYLQRGYNLKWVVLGSGFWPGIRRDSTEGTTNSFGLWDTLDHSSTIPARYPKPSVLKRFVDSAGLKLLLGLRTDFKALPSYGGNHRDSNDGYFTQMAFNKGYFVGQANPGYRPTSFISHFPRGPIWLLDVCKPPALESYMQALSRWGVQGWKEDVMFKSGVRYPQDAKLMPVYNKLMKAGYAIMVRNAYNAAAGHLVRLEDTGHNLDQDRPILNALAYAASGAGLVYPDIVGGKYMTAPLTPSQKQYMMMNLRWMTFCPGYAVGIGLWNLDSAQESEAKAILAWREKYQPYFLQQIIKTRQTGYPHAMTPIHIAFPKWDSAHTMATIKARKWAWMVGTKLLVMTLAGQDYESVNTREFMLPPGKWKSEATGQVLTGGAIITVKHWMDGLFWKVEPSIRRQRVKFYK